jgi:hypothetical protein
VARPAPPGHGDPGILTAGTFYQSDGAVFYDVHDPERTIVSSSTTSTTNGS